MQRLNAIFSYIEHGYLVDENASMSMSLPEPDRLLIEAISKPIRKRSNRFLHKSVPTCWITSCR